MVSLLAFEKLLRYFFKAIGLVCNILMFSVYNQMSMRRLSASIYFGFVAIVFICKVLNYFLVCETDKELLLYLKRFTNYSTTRLDCF